MTNKDNDNILKFKKFDYIDTQGTGIEAFSFLMPSYWKFEGGIAWNPEQVAMPACNAFMVITMRGVTTRENTLSLTIQILIQTWNQI